MDIYREKWIKLVTARKHSLRRLCFYRCVSVHRGRSTWVGTPPRQVHPLEQCMLGDTGNKWAVRILLECILVFRFVRFPLRYLHFRTILIMFSRNTWVWIVHMIVTGIMTYVKASSPHPPPPEHFWFLTLLHTDPAGNPLVNSFTCSMYPDRGSPPCSDPASWVENFSCRENTGGSTVNITLCHQVGS